MRACGSKCVATNRFTAALVAVEFQQWKRNVSTSSINCCPCCMPLAFEFSWGHENEHEWTMYIYIYMHTSNDAGVKRYQDTRKHSILRSSKFCYGIAVVFVRTLLSWPPWTMALWCWKFELWSGSFLGYCHCTQTWYSYDLTPNASCVFRATKKKMFGAGCRAKNCEIWSGKNTTISLRPHWEWWLVGIAIPI